MENVILFCKNNELTIKDASDIIYEELKQFGYDLGYSECIYNIEEQKGF